MREHMRQAIELALEALEDRASLMKWQKARDAVKEVLAQPEQEPCDGCRGSGWIPRDPDIGTDQECFVCEGTGKNIDTTPPQRTWVGLTDEEIDQGLLRSDYAFKTAEAWRAGVVFAMTKLKEKNT